MRDIGEIFVALFLVILRGVIVEISTPAFLDPAVDFDGREERREEFFYEFGLTIKVGMIYILGYG